ncbi:MAG TPA: DUF916 domain-containing protein [Candidatus Deferrimicrobium sp.]|nr:DUF916 domain-containing protein [Candidatus Deferrimicrobium sp.]
MILKNVKANRKILVCFGLFLFILAMTQTVLHASISVTPTLYELQIPKGQSYTDAIRVVNVGKLDVMVKVYLSDFDFQANGNIRFPDAGTGKYSLADYVRLNPTSLQLEPGEEKFVRFTLTMPDNLTGEYQGILFFQTLPKGIKTPAPGKQVMVSTRIGAAIYAAVKNTAIHSSEISDIFFSQAQTPGNSSFHYALLYHNNGNIHLRPTGKLKILDAAGKEVASTPVNENKTSVLRDSFRIFEGDFKNKSELRDGSYKVVSEIDYGKEILVAEKPVYLLNTGGIESFTAKLSVPAKDNDAVKIVFSSVTKGIEPGKDNQHRQKVFRIRSITGELQGELLANIPVKVPQGKTPQTLEYTGEWSGTLKPGMYIAEFLIFLQENVALTSFCLIDNTGGR